MSNSAELQAFVKVAKGQGATDEFLVAILRDKGWPAKDVYAVFARQYVDQTGIVLPEPPGRLEAAREAFFHLPAFATLATWIFSIGSIWFDLVDAWVPDPTVDRFDRFVIGSSVANWPRSSSPFPHLSGPHGRFCEIKWRIRTRLSPPCGAG